MKYKINYASTFFYYPNSCYAQPLTFQKSNIPYLYKMSHLLKIAIGLCLINLFSNCSKDMNPCESDNLVDPQVIIDSLSTQGSIFIHCELGPYYFNIDSLIAHCQSTDPQTVTGCMYDNNGGMLGSTDSYNFNIGSWPLSLNLHPDFTYTSIDTLDFYVWNNQPLTFGNHPYYGGFTINRSNSQFKFWYFNTYVGGCLHDMIAWEHKVF